MKAAVAALLAVSGGAAILWSFQGAAPAPEGVSVANPARFLSVVALIVGSLATLNYLYALSLVRQMQRGENLVGKWTVAPDTFDRFRKVERTRKKRKNNWRMPSKDWPAGLPVSFSTEAVLVGDTYFRLSSGGMSRFTYARIENEGVSSVEFSMTLTVVGTGTQSSTARYRGHLRVPIADGADVEAARVVQYFQDRLARQGG